MKREFLGDSYDVVKRMWRDLFQDVAPLFAEPRFVQNDLQSDFEKLTRIPMLKGRQSKKISILNDPDTGIRLPGEQNQREGRSHVTIASIINQLRNDQVYCVVTFDQSDYRNSILNRTQQRNAKLVAINDAGYFAFYYVSHAPFMFALRCQEDLNDLVCRIQNFGIPRSRIEKAAQQGGSQDSFCTGDLDCPM